MITIGAGTTCPRCNGPKPLGTAGKGIALSRRGEAAICSQCGTEEALLDAGIVSPDSHMAMTLEKRLIKLLRAKGVSKV